MLSEINELLSYMTDYEILQSIQIFINEIIRRNSYNIKKEGDE